MIANKRQLKKYINRLGSEIVEVVLPAAVCAKLITEDEADKLLTELATLKAQALARLDIAYDKVASDFANPRQYAKERKAYFRQAFGKALLEYEQGIQQLIEKVNTSIKK